MSGMNSWTEEDIRRFAREEAIRWYFEIKLDGIQLINQQMREKYGLQDTTTESEVQDSVPKEQDGTVGKG